MTLCYSHKKEDPFVRLDKNIVMNKSISWKAKGILSYVFSRPDDWKFYKDEMMQHSSDGRVSFDSGIKELEKAGYLYKTRVRNLETNKWEGWEWHFFETPATIEEIKEMFPITPKPNNRRTCHSENPTIGNVTPNKKDSTKNDYTKNIEIPKGISLSSLDKSKQENAGNNIFFDRNTRKFKNITQDKLDKLTKAYPSVNVNIELEQMKLWLEETPQGKLRKGSWRFIYSWIQRSFDKKEYNSDKPVIISYNKSKSYSNPAISQEARNQYINHKHKRFE